MAKWPERYRSRSKVIMGDPPTHHPPPLPTPSHASDHLRPIWKESIQNCTCCRADMKRLCQRSLCTTHPLMPVIISAQNWKNPSRTVCAVERTWQDVPYFSSHSWMNLKIFIICDTPSHTSYPLCPIWKESIQKCTYCTADTKRCAIF